MKEVFYIAQFADALAESIHDVESSKTLLKHAQISTLDIEFSHRPRDNGGI